MACGDLTAGSGCRKFAPIDEEGCDAPRSNDACALLLLRLIVRFRARAATILGSGLAALVPAMPPRPLTRLRKLCLALPEAHEVEAWGESTFRVRNKMFAMFASASNHHGGGRDAVWCKAAPENQRLLIELNPGRFFRPPYVGPSGWVGIYLDAGVDWSEVADIVRDAYRMIAPKRLLAQLDA